MNTIKSFLDSEEYQAILEKVVKQTGIEINFSYNDTFEKIFREKLLKSGLDISKLMSALLEHSPFILNYTLGKLKKYDGIEIKQEYPKNEIPDSNEKDTNIINKGLSVGFMFLNLIEFALLNSKEGLSEYFTVTKIPQAKKYEKELVNIFNASFS